MLSVLLDPGVAVRLQVGGRWVPPAGIVITVTCVGVATAAATARGRQDQRHLNTIPARTSSLRRAMAQAGEVAREVVRRHPV